MTFETLRERRGHAFFPRPEEGLPKLYSTDKTPLEDKLIVAHYFVGSCDWWVTEYDPENEVVFGYACLGDPQNAEWGYASLIEMESIAVGPGGLFIVERDLHWQPVPFRQVQHACTGRNM